VDPPERRSLAGFAGEISPSSTCWRRLWDWDEQGVGLNIWRAFLSELNERQQLQ
jgi:hypothetical protein